MRLGCGVLWKMNQKCRAGDELRRASRWCRSTAASWDAGRADPSVRGAHTTNLQFRGPSLHGTDDNEGREARHVLRRELEADSGIQLLFAGDA